MTRVAFYDEERDLIFEADLPAVPRRGDRLDLTTAEDATEHRDLVVERVEWSIDALRPSMVAHVLTAKRAP